MRRALINDRSGGKKAVWAYGKRAGQKDTSEEDVGPDVAGEVPGTTSALPCSSCQAQT